MTDADLAALRQRIADSLGPDGQVARLNGIKEWFEALDKTFERQPKVKRSKKRRKPTEKQA